MAFPIEKFKDEINAICLKHAVCKLDLFGSGTTDEFSDESDLDFLVDFQENEVNLLDKFLSLRQKLQEILRHEVDLISSDAVKNPYLKESIEATKRNVFAS